MPASPAPASEAIASRLAAGLDDYQQGVDALVDAWPDPERYRAVTGQLDAIRKDAALLPQVRVLWVELLIAHAELMHALWALLARRSEAALFHVEELRIRHAECVAGLRRRCLVLALPSAARDQFPPGQHPADCAAFYPDNQHRRGGLHTLLHDHAPTGRQLYACDQWQGEPRNHAAGYPL